MRRAHSATTHIARRAGVPCGPRPGEAHYEPPPAPKLSPLEQCVHGRDVSWIPRCTELGTFRVAVETTTNIYPQSRRAWVLNARWCADHKPAYSIPVEGS